MPKHQRPKMDPRVEAKALAAAWISLGRRLDAEWKQVYTAAELAAVEQALDDLQRKLPPPGVRLASRLLLTPGGSPRGTARTVPGRQP